MRRFQAQGSDPSEYSDHVFEALVQQLEAAGFIADWRFFDNMLGNELYVEGVGNFYIEDVIETGETEETGVIWQRAWLEDEEGNQYSASSSDYFMMAPEEVFQDTVLVLKDVHGEETIIENPTRGDLPDPSEVGTPRRFKDNAETAILYFFVCDKMQEGEFVSVEETPDGMINSKDLIEYCQTGKLYN